MKRITEYTAQCEPCGRGATGYTEEDARLACCGCDQAKITHSHTVPLADAARAYIVELEVAVNTLEREVENLRDRSEREREELREAKAIVGAERIEGKAVYFSATDSGGADDAIGVVWRSKRRDSAPPMIRSPWLDEPPTEDQARELADVISRAQAAREDRIRQNLHELVRMLPGVLKLIAQMNTTYFPGISPNSYTVNNALERLEKLAEPFGEEK